MFRVDINRFQSNTGKKLPFNNSFISALTNPQRQESIQQPVVDDTSALDGDLGDASNVAQHDNHKTFYIDEADSGEQENLGQIEMTEEEKKEVNILIVFKIEAFL